MIELTCVACGATEDVLDRVEEKRSKKCAKCGQSLVAFRQPGSAPHVDGHA